MPLHILLKNGNVKIATQDNSNGYFGRDLNSQPFSYQTFVPFDNVVMVDTNIHVINHYKQSLNRAVQ